MGRTPFAPNTLVCCRVSSVVPALARAKSSKTTPLIMAYRFAPGTCLLRIFLTWFCVAILAIISVVISLLILFAPPIRIIVPFVVHVLDAVTQVI